MKTYKRNTSPVMVIEQMYNVCYHLDNGQVKTVSEKVPLRKGLEAMKKFDRMLCSNRKTLQGIAYMFLLPLLDAREAEDNKIVSL